MITLKGEPKSTGHIYRSACVGRHPHTYMTAEGKNIKKVYQLEAKNQWKEKPLEGDIEVGVMFYFKDKRRRDLDNMNKLYLDALTGIVWNDDSQISRLFLSRHYDKNKPRIELYAIPAKL